MVAETVAEAKTEKFISSSNSKPNHRQRWKQRRRYSLSIAAIPLAVCFAIQLPRVRSFILSFSSWTAPQRQPLPPLPIPCNVHHRSISRIAASTVATEEEVTTAAETRGGSGGGTQKRDVLASLFGSHEARDAFFDDDFGTNVVHAKREASGNKIEDLGLPCIDERDGSMNMKVLFDSTNYVALRKRGSLRYLDKTSEGYDDFCAYIRDGGSAVIPVAEENALMPFRGDIEASFNQRMMLGDSGASCSVGINVYHSGPNAVALTRHCDQYDVVVLHLDGKKEWEIGVFGEGHLVDHKDAGALQEVVTWRNVTLVPGDLLYIPKGVFHAATTAEGYDSTTHATIGLEY